MLGDNALQSMRSLCKHTKGKTMKNERRLQALLDEAIVDCYDEEEQFMGVLITLNERLACR
jgi:hypothetical protein